MRKIITFIAGMFLLLLFMEMVVGILASLDGDEQLVTRQLLWSILWLEGLHFCYIANKELE